MLNAFPHALDTGFKFLFLNHALRITINDPFNTSLELIYLAGQCFPGLGVWLFLKALAVFLLQSLRVFQQLADGLPNHCIGLIHPQLLIPADPLKPMPRNIHCTGTAVISIPHIIGAPTISISAFGTNQQAL